MKAVSLAGESGVIFDRVDLVDGMFERMRGLLGRSSYEFGRAMWLKPCSSVHTFFMQFDIDLIFLDKELRVLDIRRNVSPNRMVFGPSGSKSVLELTSGSLAEGVPKTGEKLTQR